MPAVNRMNALVKFSTPRGLLVSPLASFFLHAPAIQNRCRRSISPEHSTARLKRRSHIRCALLRCARKTRRPDTGAGPREPTWMVMSDRVGWCRSTPANTTLPGFHTVVRLDDLTTVEGLDIATAYRWPCGTSALSQIFTRNQNKCDI